jgi:hypothetical protein
LSTVKNTIYFMVDAMRRWQFFLENDRRNDLSSVERATAWASEVLRVLRFIRDDRLLPLAGAEAIPLMPLWALASQAHFDTVADRTTWATNTNVLRSVAGRVEKFRGRRIDVALLEAVGQGYGFEGKPEVVAQLAADEVMARYVALAEPQVQRGSKPMREVRVKLIADGPHERDKDGVMKLTVRDFATASSIFWQSTFSSLVPTNAEHVCADCGRDLGPTPKNRTRRAKRCAKCTYKHWWEMKSPEERRRIECEKKRRWRENQST